MRPSVAGLALAAVLVAAHAASAQAPFSEREAGRPPRVYLGGNALLGQPESAFKDNVPRSWGGSMNMLVAGDRHGILGLRLDGGAMIYGHESKRVLLSPTVGGRVHVDLSTNNGIAYVGLGPQLMLPNGKLRPYVAGTVGVAYFFTISSIDGANNSEDFASDTNFDDVNLAYRGIGGLYVPLYRGASPVSLDLSVQYHNNGVASYLKKGSITDNPDGSISFTPMTSQANVISFHIGATVGVGPSHHQRHKRH